MRKDLLPRLLLLAAASCAGPRSDASAPPAPSPTSSETATLTLEVESLGECHDDPVPHHGAVPRADELGVTGGSRSARIHLANIDGSCPDPVTFRLVPARGGDARIEIVHGTSPRTRLWRDAVVLLRGLAPGPRTIEISHSTAPNQAQVLSAEVTP